MCQMSDFAHLWMRIFNFNIRGFECECLYKIDFSAICYKIYCQIVLKCSQSINLYKYIVKWG